MAVERLSMPKDVLQNFYSKANIIKLGLHLFFPITWQKTSAKNSISFPQVAPKLCFPSSQEQFKALVFKLADNTLNNWRSFVLFP